MNVRKFCTLVFSVFLSGTAFAQEFKSGMEWSEPPIVTPGATDDQPPSDAIVLFDGQDMSAWEGSDWQVADGVVSASKGDVTTKQAFGDIQLHIEWSAPTEVRGNGQGRGNSGVFLMNRYEVQVLDSFDNETYFDGQAASVYKQTPPMVNAVRKPGEWNTYDLFWTAPTFNVSGDVATPACVTLVHNGVLVLNHFELYGPTNYLGPAQYAVHEAKAPIRLQDHGNPVRFRNIWVRELQSPVGARTSAPYVIKGGKNIPFRQAEQEQADGQLKRAIQQAVDKAVKKAVEQALKDNQKKPPRQEPEAPGDSKTDGSAVPLESGDEANTKDVK